MHSLDLPINCKSGTRAKSDPPHLRWIIFRFRAFSCEVKNAGQNRQYPAVLTFMFEAIEVKSEWIVQILRLSV
ncbi:hypothetical protein AM571_PC00845 (plasmid) [Rhizobium etli 8C-3]|uniref:Uncharacterized protein n=1 Tax=Rhizobium etli 8C-3 TaxID=538025 RepID=A0A1L5PEN6_RHIET|nr:hypothetical protein AM571_PC00845 [Rhizobium etli 8C-3]